MIARVVSQDVVELDIIDLVGGLSLETLLNDVEFFCAHLHAEVIEDRSETSEGNEPTTALVLILEVRFDQKASVLDISAKTLKASHQNLFFLSV